MDFLLTPIPLPQLTDFETWVNDWVFVLSFAFLGVELVRYAVQKRLNWSLLGDTISNYITFAGFIVLNYIVLGVFYLAAYFYFQQFALFDIETNLATVAICIVLADLAYYWEHRFTHRVNVAWATHTVHHSSPHFNISVANRFGPMDGVWPIFFHAPLIVAGFDPLVVLFAEIMVQTYQTILHTEVIGKLPRPFEFFFNTPSHHRVHHGSNAQYLDKNYGGVFIIWDRMFGTFAKEEEPVVYGLVRPINSVNPVVIWFHGFTRLGAKVAHAPGLFSKLRAILGPPEWEPPERGTRQRFAPAE